MTYLKKALLEKEKELTKLLKAVPQPLAPRPDFTIQPSCVSGTYRYYQFTPATADHPGKRKYLPRSQDSFVRDMVSQEFDRTFYRAIQHQLNQVQRFRTGYDEFLPERLYSRLSPGKQCLVTPYKLPVELFIAAWEAEEFKSNPMEITNTEYYSHKNEHMRSKSEMTIANLLNYHHIPYRYEAALALPNGRFIYPDFTLLDPVRRCHVYWEHFGMMDDPQYRDHTLNKIDLYAELGIYPGINFICTFESANHTLNTKTATRYIHAYFPDARSLLMG